MPKKIFYEEVKKFIESLGYKLINREYLGVKHKLILKDKDGYFYLVTFESLTRGAIPYKFSSYNPYTIQNIKLWCELNNKLFELISDTYIDAHEKLKWKCLKDICGETFKASWNDMYSNQGCPFCVGHQIGLSNCLATKNPELAKEWHPTKNGKLTPYDVTISSGKDVWWQCKDNPKHEWEASMASRTNMNSGCPYCTHKLPSEDYNLLICSPELASEWNYNKNDKTPKDYTPHSNEKVWWKCKEKECGHEWFSVINNRNNNRGCPACNNSKGEKECRRFFDLRNIFYVSQKTFEGLIGLGGGLLSYDFYLPQYNLLIEYQGEYHDQIILNYKNESIELAEARLIKQQEHDRRKRQHCKDNNINLLEIWYWDFDNIEEILNKEIGCENN